jgi:hypothetical protein
MAGAYPPSEFNIGFAYPEGAVSGEREEFKLYDFAGEDALDIVSLDYETGIFSITFDEAAVWGMEVYKPKTFEPQPDTSYFSTLTFKVNAADDDKTPLNDDKTPNTSSGGGCDTGLGLFGAILLAAGTAVVSKIKLSR